MSMAWKTSVLSTPYLMVRLNCPVRQSCPPPDSRLRSSPGIPKFDSVTEERQWQLEHMAAAFRHWCREGYVEGISGHISVRDPEHRDAFWTNPLGVHFGLLKASDMILVNLDGKVIGGNRTRPPNTAGFLIHAAVHKARSDVHAVCHAHTGIHPPPPPTISTRTITNQRPGSPRQSLVRLRPTHRNAHPGLMQILQRPLGLQQLWRCRASGRGRRQHRRGLGSHQQSLHPPQPRPAQCRPHC